MDPIIIPFTGHTIPLPPCWVPLPNEFLRYRGIYLVGNAPTTDRPEVRIETPSFGMAIQKANNLAKHKLESLQTKDEKLVMVNRHTGDGWVLSWIEKSYAASFLRDKLTEWRTSIAHLREHLDHDGLTILKAEASNVVDWVNAQVEATKPRFAINLVAKKLNRRPSTLIMWEKNREFPLTVNPLFLHCWEGCRCRHYTEEEINLLFRFRDRRNGFGKCDEHEATPPSLVPT